MTTPGVVRRARAGWRLPTAACVTLMAAVVGGTWAIVPSNETPAAATTPSASRAGSTTGVGTVAGAGPTFSGPSVADGTAVPATGAAPAAKASTGVPANGAPVDQPAAVMSLSSTTPGAQAPAAPAPPAWAGSLPPAGVAWSPYIDAAAAKEGLDPRLFASLVWAESNFDAAAVSGKGAVGLAQVMPTTAADLGVDPANPLENLAGGARYLKKNLDRFGSADLALAAYNAGPTTVAETGGIPDIHETVQYVGKVLTLYQALAESDPTE